MISSPTKLVRSQQPQPAEAKPSRTIDRSKPKVRLDGTAAADCIPCQQKKQRS